ncbi:MAG: hypothetical protein V1944_00685 [Candidatus Aenigmatarchaeota archaeon]
MSIAKIKCPECGKQIQKKVLKITHGKCSNCGFSLASSLAKFSSARSRVQNKYR